MAEHECEFLNPEIENTSVNCQKEGTLTMAILLHIAIDDIVEGLYSGPNDHEELNKIYN